ncbi:MAG: hypothetical protein ABIK91_05940 [Pseudomonadota bacterium]
MKALVIFLSVLLLLSCSTFGQVGLRDFNEDFNVSVPADPQYKITAAGSDGYEIVIFQGSILISERSTRANFLGAAGLAAIEAYCTKKGDTLGKYTFQRHVDGLGYVYVTGHFTCTSKLITF